ncbi:MAG: endonuclease III domain-containing protein [Candidatus Hinthialibacter sp.]
MKTQKLDFAPLWPLPAGQRNEDAVYSFFIMAKIDLMEVYQTLLHHFGHRNWWPGETPMEICIGAILTQNTNWKNVERAIANLKQAHFLSYKGLKDAPLDRVRECIRPSGYYNQKALKLKAFTVFLAKEYSGSLAKMFREETPILRQKLLRVKGIGPETADSILLYAGRHPVFVIDLYTYRIVTRHGWLPEETRYEELQEFFQDNIPPDVDLYNDFHAQLVAAGANYCRKTPQCEECPLKRFLNDGF